MKIAVFSTKPYDRTSLLRANDNSHELTFFEPHLDATTAALAEGFAGVCVFVNDTLDAAVLTQLHQAGVRLIALRCAGFNNVDLSVADRLGLTVCRVPAYSPHSVAEHALALILALNRKTHRAFNRVREGNFSIEGLLGFDLHGRTVGVIGTGQIGQVFCQIMIGLGCRVIAYDVVASEACRSLGVEYLPVADVLAQADIISLHCPLNPATHHMLNSQTLGGTRRGVMIINTSRGALVDTRALIAGLKSGQIAYLGIDVYEEEADLFFEDRSGRVLQDDVFARLITFPNVLVTAHQGFFTEEALTAIAATTIANLTEFAYTGIVTNRVTAQKRSGPAADPHPHPVPLPRS